MLPLPYATSAEADWDRGLLSPSNVRLAPRTGFALSLDDSRVVVRGGYGIFLNQWAYSVQTAFARNLPFFFTKQVDIPSTQLTPLFKTSDILTADPTGVVAATIMDHEYAVEYTQTWSGGIQMEPLPSTAMEISYMGSWTLGADNATVHNVRTQGPAPSSPGARFPSSVRSDRSDSTANPSITASHSRRSSGCLTTTRTASATHCPRRKTMPRVPDPRKPKPMCRRMCETSSATRANGRPRASTTGTCSWPAGPTSCRPTCASMSCSSLSRARHLR